MMFDPATSTGPFLDLLVPLLKDEEEPFVVLLGAGCSCQYGLPTFTELLYRVALDLWPHRRTELTGADLSALRARLDATWKQSSPERIRRLLKRHLQKISGHTCPGYRTLAQLAKEGYVHYFVNMNFDTLLEEACQAEGVCYEVSHSFPDSSSETKTTIIVKPNGSMKKGGGAPILDIAQSDLAASSGEEKKAANLLQKHHVLVLGYSGIDARIAQILGKSKRQLFVVNLGGPGYYLNEALKRRNSLMNSLQHTAAAFSYFSECLKAEVFLGQPIAVENDLYFTFSYLLSLQENLAATKWRQLAHEVQSTINVLAFSGPSLERHAQQLFDVTRKVAEASGIALTSPEIYILRAVSYVHDLGFYASLAPSRRASYPGLRLLREHGSVTVDLLSEYLNKDRQKAEFGPESYTGESRLGVTESVLIISQLHGRADLSPDEDELLKTWQAEIGSCSVTVRPRLLHGLVVLAEELLQIIAPSKTLRPTGRRTLAHEQGTPLDDPVLAAYMVGRNLELTYSLDYGRLTLDAPQGEALETKGWLVCRIGEAFESLLSVLSETVDDSVPLTLQSSIECKTEPRQQLLDALAEQLEAAVADLDNTNPTSSVQYLDLLSIYCLSPTPRDQSQEPRLALTHPVAKDLLSSASRFSDCKSQLLYHYFESIQNDNPSFQDLWFRECFERVLYPGWRYLARKWEAGVQPVSFAPSVLRFGSSRFRPEVLTGLSRLLHEGISESKNSNFQYCHRGCMLCTGSVLSSLSLVQARVWPEDLTELSEACTRAGRGILRFLESPQLSDDDWLGFFEDTTMGTERIQSIGYLARAIQGLADVYVATLANVKSKAEWLPSKRRTQELLLNRWQFLLNLPNEKIESATSETSLLDNLIDVSTCWLVSRHNGIDFLGSPHELLSASCKLDKHVSRLDRSRAIPIAMILANANNDTTLYEEIINVLCQCTVSPVWIETATGAGSYGFNEDTTEELLRSLFICWIEILNREDEQLSHLFPAFPGAPTTAS